MIQKLRKLLLKIKQRGEWKPNLRLILNSIRFRVLFVYKRLFTFLKKQKKKGIGNILRNIPKNLRRSGSTFYIYKYELEFGRVWPHLSFALLSLIVFVGTAYAKDDFLLKNEDIIEPDDIVDLAIEVDKFTPFINEGESIGAVEMPEYTELAMAEDGYLLSVPKSGSVIASESIDAALETKNEKVATSKGRTEVITYRVKAGDTLTRIAKRFGLAISTLKNSNHIDDINNVGRGSLLYIPAADGVIAKVKEGESISSIVSRCKGNYIATLRKNELSVASKIYPGQLLTIVGGKVPYKPKKKYASISSGRSSASGSVRGASYTEGSGYAYGNFSHPCPGSCFRGYHWHALDCMRSSGTPIYAADGGIVTIARYGWNWGFGNYVVIDHRNGFTSYYAHQSRLGVRVGQRVNKRQVIGYVGSTGNSRGNHLHFEIRRFGVKSNTGRYLGI